MSKKSVVTSVTIFIILCLTCFTNNSFAAAKVHDQIANKQATQILAKAENDTKDTTLSEVSNAHIKHADKLLADGKKKEALQIYKQLYLPNEPETIRSAALRGIVLTTGEDSIATVIEALKGENTAIQEAAVQLINEIPGEKMLNVALEQLPNLPDNAQKQMLTTLASRGDSTALPAVITLLNSSKDKTVRIEAIRTISVLGDASVVPVLAHRAEKTRKDERQEAIDALVSLKGKDINETMIKLLGTEKPITCVMLIPALEQRNATEALPDIIEKTKTGTIGVKMKAWNAIKTLATPSDLPALFEIMHPIDTPERLNAERAITHIAQQVPDKEKVVDMLLEELAKAPHTKAKCSIYTMFGEFPVERGLPVLYEAMDIKNSQIKGTAVMALSKWPDARPIEKLMQIAKTDVYKPNRILALKGYTILIGLESDRPASETIELYKKAFEQAETVNGRKMVLSGLADQKSIEALQLAESYLIEKLTQNEAAAAIIKISQQTKDSHPQETKAALQKILEITENESISKQSQELIDKIEKTAN